MPSHGKTTQARVIALLFALRLSAAASWRCSVNIEGDPSQVLVYIAASMRCFSNETEQNLTVYADASLLSYASSFTGVELQQYHPATWHCTAHFCILKGITASPS
ncbi:hypothetical protein WJX79_006619 [Trebouxia sp. C0005]